MIVDANREIWQRTADSRRARQQAAGTRRRIAAIDEFISMLEDRHLDGERTFDRVLRQRLVHLAAEVGMPLPRKVVRARNTTRLHAALLDWQETVFDAVLPERLEFADVHDNDWSTPQPVGW